MLLFFEPVFASSRDDEDLRFTFREAGFKKYLRNYSRKECLDLSVNRAILQDKRGVMYFGGEGGLREYNGVSWKSIPVPNDWVSAMDIDKNGVIYIGGNNEIGFLARNRSGMPYYKSLTPYLKPHHTGFTVLNVHAVPEGIYFNAGKFLFLWTPRSTGGTISAWEPSAKGKNQTRPDFGSSFLVNRTLFIQENRSGLKQMKNDRLHPVPGFEKAAGEHISMMVPYTAGKILVGTRAGNLYLSGGGALVPFPTETAGHLRENHLLYGLRLSSGDYALATFFGGVTVINPDGSIVNIINKLSGLPDSLVNYIYQDFQGNLWLALEAGISRVEHMSPFSTHIFPPRFIGEVTKYNGSFYLSTDNGLQMLTPSGKLQPVPGLDFFCRILLPIGDSLLITGEKGIYSFDGKNATILTNELNCLIIQSKINKNRAWASTKFEIFSLLRTKHRWIIEKSIKFGSRLFKKMVEDRKGNLWIGTIDKYKPNPEKIVLKIHYPGQKVPAVPEPLITRFDRSSGLPGDVNGIFSAAGHVIFSTNNGIYRFDETGNRFVPDLLLGEQLAAVFKKKNIITLVEDHKKDIWAAFDDGAVLHAVYRREGTYALNELPFLRIPQSERIKFIYPDPGQDIVWLVSDKNFLFYNRQSEKNCRQPFRTLVYKVSAHNTTVFHGAHPAGKHQTVPPVSYSDRNLSFHFTAPFFERENATRYRYKLDGLNRQWSSWKTEPFAVYNDLDSGDYRFLVEAENIYRKRGQQDAFQFRVLPPWYRTLWAFVSYFIILSMLAYLMFKWRRAIQLERDKQKLEHIVRERIEEIKRKNFQLENQTLRLKEQSEKLKELDKVKSRFFANISHEFRTPLSLIIGPLEQMIAAGPPDRAEALKKLTLMLRNSQRLLRLIDQLLELSKLESGKMKLRAYPQDIVLFIKGIAASFETAASKNELDLTVNAPDAPVIVYFDPGKMEEIWFNLFSNAVKFTPAGGRVTVTVMHELSRDFVSLSICDTGPGIPREQLSYIFDRFFQADSTHEHHKKGSGIGLALARELVELHHGTIEARNTQPNDNNHRDDSGRGAEFIVRLPLGKNHLGPGEIVESADTPFKHKIPGEIPGSYLPGNGEITGDAVPEPAPLSFPAKQTKEIILVIEDNADFREYIKETLEAFYSVTAVEDGDAGFDKAVELIPDLIISDVMMPGQDGFQLCGQLKQNRDTSHIPVILLTARASEQSIVRGLDTGADDYITKPFSSNILLSRIKNLIEQRRRLQVQRLSQVTVPPPEKKIPSVDEVFYKELESVMEKNLSNPGFNIEQLKDILCMGRTTLYRKILALTGLSPNRFIRTFRLKRAAQLLEANFGNVSEVAMAVGFSNMAYFSQCFKEEFHQSPSAYQSSKN